MADPVITAQIPEEVGKRHPYNAVSVGLCSSFKEAARVGAPATALCAAFQMVNPVIGDENNGIVVMTEADLNKAAKNGMAKEIAGFTQAQQMIRDVKR